MIHLPPGASPVLQFAADELRRAAPWLEQQAAIALGPPEWAPEAAGLGPRRVAGHPDGFLIVSDGDRCCLTAKSDRGALYAVYALLERIGARWPHPGACRPPEPGARLPRLDEHVEPSYDGRGICLNGPASTADVLELITWGARRGLNLVRATHPDGLDLEALGQAAAERAVTFETGPLAEASRTQGRCFKHSIGNPYGCTVNPALFRQFAGLKTAAEPYADLDTLGGPANLATVIRQDLEDCFRESLRSFYLVHSGARAWWTCPLNFDVYARTLWDLNTDPAEVLADFAGDNERLERDLGQAEEASGAALCACCTPTDRATGRADADRLLLNLNRM